MPDDFNGVVATLPDTASKLPKDVVRAIGYTEEELKSISNVYSETLDIYRKHPIEKVAVSFNQPMRFRRLDNTMFMAKKNVKYIITLMEIVKLCADENLRKIMKITGDVKKYYRKYEGEDLNNKSLLVWMDGGIGDTLFYKAIIDAIKEKYPLVTVNAAAAGWFHPMLKNWDTFRKIYSIPFTFVAYNKHDYHLNFDGVIVRVREAERTNVYKHLVNWCNLDINYKNLVPFQRSIYQNVKKAKNKLRKWGHLDNFIIVNTASRSKIRSTSSEFTIKLWNKLIELGFNIALIDFKNRASHYDALIKKVDKPERILNYCSSIDDLNDSVAIVSLAKMMISVDTANNHIAASVRVPNFGICGPFEGFLRLETYPKTTWVDAICDLGACHSHAVHDNSCPRSDKDGNPDCYEALDIDELSLQILEHYNANIA